MTATRMVDGFLRSCGCGWAITAARAAPRSVRAGASEDHADSAEQDHEVRQQVPVAGVAGVERDAGDVIDVVAAADLPQARDAWAAPEIGAERFAVARDLRRDNRSRTDQTHVASQDIDELRQLVEACAPQQLAER